MDKTEETCIVEMPVNERSAKGMRYGWECAECQSSTGLAFDLKRIAEDDLAIHLATHRMTEERTS